MTVAFRFGVVFLLLCTCSSLHADEQTDRPNIVLIIADDQAYTDFGFMGHPIVRTPHLDRLAAGSARFPNGYVPTSLCRPSLATLLTGLYPHQHQIHFNDPPDRLHRESAEVFIRNLPTLPRWLGAVGYRSLQTGKFWEGSHKNAGFTAGMTHGDPKRIEAHPTLKVLLGRHGDRGLTIGRDTMQPIFDFIDSAGKEHFFIWYAPFLPHEPFTPPGEYRDLYADQTLHPRLRDYYAMCTWLDATVGELLRYLAKKKLAEKTFVVFVVDNGWITDTSRPHGFAPKSKRSPFEMGIRTPILLHWPGRIEPGEHAELVSSIDLVPTLLAAAGLGARASGLPGHNLLPLATGTGGLDRDTVVGEIYNHDAVELGKPQRDLLYRWVRRANSKLIDATQPAEFDMLFDLDADPLETRNLISDPDQQEHLRDLRKRLVQFAGTESSAADRHDPRRPPE